MAYCQSRMSRPSTRRRRRSYSYLAAFLFFSDIPLSVRRSIESVPHLPKRDILMFPDFFRHHPGNQWDIIAGSGYPQHEHDVNILLQRDRAKPVRDFARPQEIFHERIRECERAQMSIRHSQPDGVDKPLDSLTDLILRQNPGFPTKIHQPFMMLRGTKILRLFEKPRRAPDIDQQPENMPAADEVRQAEAFFRSQ